MNRRLVPPELFYVCNVFEGRRSLFFSPVSFHFPLSLLLLWAMYGCCLQWVSHGRCHHQLLRHAGPQLWTQDWGSTNLQKLCPLSHPRPSSEWLQASRQTAPLQSFQDVPCGGVKKGRFGILRFPLFCSVWGAQDTQILGEKKHEKCHCHTPFCAPQMPVETGTWEQCPRMLAGKAQGKWHIDPILPKNRRTIAPETTSQLKSPPEGHSLKTITAPLNWVRNGPLSTSRSESTSGWRVGFWAQKRVSNGSKLTFWTHLGTLTKAHFWPTFIICFQNFLGVGTLPVLIHSMKPAGL